MPRFGRPRFCRTSGAARPSCPSYQSPVECSTLGRPNCPTPRDLPVTERRGLSRKLAVHRACLPEAGQADRLDRHLLGVGTSRTTHGSPDCVLRRTCRSMGVPSFPCCEPRTCGCVASSLRARKASAFLRCSLPGHASRSRLLALATGKNWDSPWSRDRDAQLYGPPHFTFSHGYEPGMRTVL